MWFRPPTRPPIFKPPPPRPGWPRPIALKPHDPHYVIPFSQKLDPPYAWQAQRTWPFPRHPWPFETESRAPGTGLLHARPARFCPRCGRSHG